MVLLSERSQLQLGFHEDHGKQMLSLFPEEITITFVRPMEKEGNLGKQEMHPFGAMIAETA